MRALVISLSLLLASCGSMGALKATNGAEGLSLAAYNRVVVQNIEDHASMAVEAAVMPRKIDEVAAAKETFAGLIRDEIAKLRVFNQVSRLEVPRKGTLIVSGSINRLEEGTATERLVIGLTGRSELQATLELRDGATKRLLASMDVDESSWIIMGFMGGSQSPESFMASAAEYFAEELRVAKLR